MPVSHKIISAKDQPNGGNGMISIAGARGLGSSGTLITELSSNNRFSPFTRKLPEPQSCVSSEDCFHLHIQMKVFPYTLLNPS